MKMRNITRRAGAVMLMLALLLTLCPAGLAAEREVRIGSAEELVKFAEKCASDSYSSGLTAVLTDNIDLDGAAVYMDGRKVGRLVTVRQQSNERAMGAALSPV